MQHVKICIVGTPGVGRSKTMGEFDHYGERQGLPEQTDMGDPRSYKITFEDKEVNLGIWMPNCAPDYDRLRPLWYVSTDLYLVFASVTDPESFEDARAKWFAELRYHSPNTPIALIGTKTDLRRDSNTLHELAQKNQAPLTYEEGLKFAQICVADFYWEISSLRSSGIRELINLSCAYIFGMPTQKYYEPILPSKPDPPLVKSILNDDDKNAKVSLEDIDIGDREVIDQIRKGNGSMLLTDQNVFKMMQIAHQKELSSVTSACEVYLTTDNKIENFDIFDTLTRSINCKAKQLQSYCLWWIKVNYDKYKDQMDQRLAKPFVDEINRESWPGDDYYEKLRRFKTGDGFRIKKNKKKDCAVQ